MKHIPSMAYVSKKLQWEGFNLIHMRFPIFSELIFTNCHISTICSNT